MAQLLEGKVLVESTLLDESGGAARVIAVFHTPAPEIWKLLGNCEANFRFVQGLLDCEVTESSSLYAVSRQVVKRNLITPRMEYRFESFRQPFDWIAIRLIDGDLKHLRGSWRFDALEELDAVLVTHRIQVQPRLPAPRWLIRRTLRKDIADMVACLRHLADASGDELTADSDASRCPDPEDLPSE